VRLLDRSTTVLLLLVALVAAGPGPAFAVPAPAALSAALSAPASPVGTAVAISGALTPAAPGQPVRLERSRGGTWHGVAQQGVGAGGAFRFVVAPDAPGWWSYRVTAGPLAQELPRLDVHRVLTYSLATRGSVGPDAAGSRRWSPRSTPTRAAGCAATAGSPGSRAGATSPSCWRRPRSCPSFSRSCSARYSCRVGRHVVLNADRWRLRGARLPGSLEQYRQMVLNHETGHWLGLGHEACPGRGRPAPVMQQQSKAMQGCAPNAWPLDAELTAVRR
jgi:hypothetical protein